MSTFNESLRSWAFHGVVEDRRARYALGVVAFALATAFGAQVAVTLPWTPVPVTMQPLFVVLAGVVLGPRLGALSLGAYVTIGALGAPVFSNGGAGLPWLFGPTGGYLLAAPVAAFAAGALSGRDGQPARLLAGLVIGIAILYVGGVAQLMAITGQNLPATLAIGVLPFLIGDATKVAVAFFGVQSVRWARHKRG